jgi:hypothetical protein
MLFRTPLPFQDALDSRLVKSILPTDFRTQLLREIPAVLRERAMFSAGVTNAEFLEKANDSINELVSGTTDRATKRLELKKLLDQLGYHPAEGEEGTLTDLSSDARLNLILDTNLEQAQGYGYWKQGQQKSVLDQWPAQELIRVTEPKGEERDWAARWTKCGGEFFGGRMIALKNDDIWDQLGDSDTFSDGLDNPYPPFAFNSGMDVTDVDRDEAVKLGLINEDTQIEPEDRGFNDDLQASPEVREKALQQALVESLAGIAKLVGGVLKFTGGN